MQRKGFPICPYYAIRAQLRQPALKAGGADETDSGVAGPQRHLHHSEHLCASGRTLQAAERRDDVRDAGIAGGIAGEQVVMTARGGSVLAFGGKILASRRGKGKKIAAAKKMAAGQKH